MIENCKQSSKCVALNVKKYLPNTKPNERVDFNRDLVAIVKNESIFFLPRSVLCLTAPYDETTRPLNNELVDEVVSRLFKI